MNVLHVESSLNWGGQEHRTLAEARWLNRNGHRAWIACNRESALFARATEMRIGVPMRASFDAAALLAIRELCRKHAIDVVHVHSPKDAWICYPLHLLGVPLVRSRQITNPVPRQWSRSFVYRHGCAKIIATAECIRRDLIARNAIAPSRIVVIGEGVDPEKFNPGVDGASFRKEFGVADDALLYGVIAMIRPEKGHGVFVEAARAMLTTHPRARFAMVGEGTGGRETEHDLRAKLRAHFGCERSGPIFMTGFRADAAIATAALDVLVVPSTAEAQSLVVPQAFATRRAVIASEVGGLPEIVRHADTGLLVAPGAPVPLAAAMRRLADDAALRNRLARNGYAFARRHLLFQRKMEENIAIYAEVSAPKRRGVRRPAARKARADRMRAWAAWQSRGWRWHGVAALLIFAFLLGRVGMDFSNVRLSDAPAASVVKGFSDAGRRALVAEVRAKPGPDDDDDDDVILPDDDDDDDVVT